MKKSIFIKACSAILILILALAMMPVKPAQAATVVDTYSTAGTYTWTAPPDVTSVNVEAWGGGGSGGSFVLVIAETARGGGGGGAYSSSTVTVVPGNTYTIVVGAGANALAAAGGDSYFGTATTVMAKGGASASSVAITGGAGGLASAGFGTTKFSGGSGANGNTTANYGGGGGSSAGTGANGTTATNVTGAVAPTGGGNGGNGRVAPVGPGSPGSTPGGGGGGAYNPSGFNAGQAGGNGANGRIILTYTSDYRIFTNPGSFTWIAPPGVTSIDVEVWGGGGRGGNVAGGFSGEAVAGGGGGGAYSRSTLTVIPGNSYTVVVGIGSTSTAAGGDSYFDTATTVMAKGGNSSNSATGASGGSAAAGFGTTKYSGGTGANGNATGDYSGGGGSSAGTAVSGTNATNATGASAPVGGGNGGNGKTTPTGAGTVGGIPGGGGGGAYRNGAGFAQNGGNGANGLVVITINVNSPPTGGDGSVTTGEDTTYTFTAADFTTLTTPAYNDAEGDPFAGIQVTSLETAGTLQCGGVDVPLNGTCANVTTLTFAPVANANGTPYATFQFQVYDGTSYSVSSYTMTINITAINDEPAQTIAPDQFRTDAITAIAQGGTTNEASVVFKGTATDTEGDQYMLEVEAVNDANPFTGIATCTSPLTNSGTEASTGSCGPFASGSYIWRYRFVDSGSGATPWTVFGASDPDFVVDPALLVIAANGINSIPDTGDNSIAENEIIPPTLGIAQLIVQFNKDVYDDPADLLNFTDDVTNPANYRLLYSATGTFNTLGCVGGVVAPDIPLPVTSVTYSNGGGSGPFIATINLSTPLNTVGFYRLYVCGTTSVVQATNQGFALAGNGTTAGTDFIRNFQLSVPLAGGGVGSTDDEGGGTSGRRTATALTVAALPATGFAPNRVTLLAEQPEDLAYADLGDLWIEIPALGIKTSIVGVPQTKEGDWDVTWLANNVGWLNGTAFPTWEGNSVITAHVTNADGLDGPFAELKKLKYGDQIIVHLYDEKYTFEVRNSRLSRPYTTSFAFEPLDDQSYLTLITCQLYIPTSDTYFFRRVVRAVLVEVENE